MSVMLVTMVIMIMEDKIVVRNTGDDHDTDNEVITAVLVSLPETR